MAGSMDVAATSQGARNTKTPAAVINGLASAVRSFCPPFVRRFSLKFRLLQSSACSNGGGCSGAHTCAEVSRP